MKLLSINLGMTQFYIIMGEIFCFILMMLLWASICYGVGLWLMHRPYIKDKIARFLLKHIYHIDIH